MYVRHRAQSSGGPRRRFGIDRASPSVVVLFLGWSVLEGLGDALIMPTVTALVAGNFTGQQRARAYGLIAASAAVAVAAGPIIGGFVTANFSWRWSSQPRS